MPATTEASLTLAENQNDAQEGTKEEIVDDVETVSDHQFDIAVITQDDINDHDSDGELRARAGSRKRTATSLYMDEEGTGRKGSKKNREENQSKVLSILQGFSLWFQI